MEPRNSHRASNIKRLRQEFRDTVGRNMSQSSRFLPEMAGPSERVGADVAAATEGKPPAASEDHATLAAAAAFTAAAAPAEAPAEAPAVNSASSGDNANGTAAGASTRPPGRQRNKLGYHRVSQACNHCRRRKIRCLNTKPEEHADKCDSCFNLARTCSYGDDTSGGRATSKRNRRRSSLPAANDQPSDSQAPEVHNPTVPPAWETSPQQAQQKIVHQNPSAQPVWVGGLTAPPPPPQNWVAQGQPIPAQANMASQVEFQVNGAPQVSHLAGQAPFVGAMGQNMMPLVPLSNVSTVTPQYCLPNLQATALPQFSVPATRTSSMDSSPSPTTQVVGSFDSIAMEPSASNAFLPGPMGNAAMGANMVGPRGTNVIDNLVSETSLMGISPVRALSTDSLNALAGSSDGLVSRASTGSAAQGMDFRNVQISSESAVGPVTLNSSPTNDMRHHSFDSNANFTYEASTVNPNYVNPLTATMAANALSNDMSLPGGVAFNVAVTMPAFVPSAVAPMDMVDPTLLPLDSTSGNWMGGIGLVPESQYGGPPTTAMGSRFLDLSQFQAPVPGAL